MVQQGNSEHLVQSRVHRHGIVGLIPPPLGVAPLLDGAFPPRLGSQPHPACNGYISYHTFN